MTKKRACILALVAVTAVLFAVIRCYVLPTRQAEAEAYAQRQTDARTHDITAIAPYRSPYMGDNSNTVALFQSLPLGQLGQTYELDSDACTVTVRYQAAAAELGLAVVQRDLVYDSVAAMAAIDNLKGVTYAFSDGTDSFSRAELEAVFGKPLSGLLEADKWTETVQKPLDSEAFVAQFYP